MCIFFSGVNAISPCQQSPPGQQFNTGTHPPTNQHACQCTIPTDKYNSTNIMHCQIQTVCSCTTYCGYSAFGYSNTCIVPSGYIETSYNIILCTLEAWQFNDLGPQAQSTLVFQFNKYHNNHKHYCMYMYLMSVITYRYMHIRTRTYRKKLFLIVCIPPEAMQNPLGAQRATVAWTECSMQTSEVPGFCERTIILTDVILQLTYNVYVRTCTQCKQYLRQARTVYTRPLLPSPSQYTNINYILYCRSTYMYTCAHHLTRQFL